MNLVHIESLSFWTIIVFVCLLLLLRAYAWKPILKALKEREQSINNALDAADEAKKEMANLKADNEKLLSEARLERDNMLKEAREIKERIISQAKEEAHNEGAKLIAQAKVSIENEKKIAIAQLKEQVASLSIEIAKKVLTKELASEVKQEQLVESLLNEINLKA
ncbi:MULTISPECIES: F0F1 ATP synthase subunit B [unclassified Capnocytophaga]|jgi:ATP synthase, F0 subunit b|uniref:F0F1 ATP synthase subunit B n=1 Tax=unclassified Capnocytophaga TaxID=2640652 RepID=UPI000202D65D|nr:MULTISPECIES: F0F1 ATP synthase subunit B [unclassified Capnocytophaga]EGD35101.1 ATP synthase F0 sector subunit B [Capnocytophaga sp. oral taxon 338 str. F0234]MEB3003966.1 F0F1 ATP synthase subunit B [Capnocytophaga sp. G2]